MECLYYSSDVTGIGPHRSSCTTVSGWVALRPRFRRNGRLFTFPSRHSIHFSSLLLLTRDVLVVAICSAAIISGSSWPNPWCYLWMSSGAILYAESSSHWPITYIRSTILAIPSTLCYLVITAPTQSNLSFNSALVKLGAEIRGSLLSSTWSTLLRITFLIRTLWLWFIVLISKRTVPTPTTGNMYPFRTVTWRGPIRTVS